MTMLTHVAVGLCASLALVLLNRCTLALGLDRRTLALVLVDHRLLRNLS